MRRLNGYLKRASNLIDVLGIKYNIVNSRSVRPRLTKILEQKFVKQNFS